MIGVPLTLFTNFSSVTWGWHYNMTATSYIMKFDHPRLGPDLPFHWV